MYDFRSLSDLDFELFTRDLLQEYFAIRLESFKKGRDGGVDLRYARGERNSLIVQCKHYANSTFALLKRELEKEVPKLKKLKPKRYIVATSFGLTPGNKEAILELLDPYCLGSDDIFGCEDLNNLLGMPKYEWVLRQHYKLWLTSTFMLQELLHGSTINETRAIVESIKSKASTYVQNGSYFEAIEILNKHNYCIISGEPGIGKTFLAEILLLKCIGEKFRPIAIRENIDEAWGLLKSDENQVFYFDDFLGVTGRASRLGRNEDRSIVRFLKYVKDHKHARFILTTREYILREAKQQYEAFEGEEVSIGTCIIKMGSYTRSNKAHILFNHLFASKLPRSYILSLLDRNALLAIVDHKQYSPRIIEAMTDLNKAQDHSPNDYPRVFIATLNDPTIIWERIFTKQISKPSQSLLLTLCTFPYAVEMSELEVAFNALRANEVRLLGGAIEAYDFRNSLNSLENTFLRCERGTYGITVFFINPSVRDFLERYLSLSPQQMQILCESFIYYDQVRAFSAPRANEPVRQKIISHMQAKVGQLCEAILRSVGTSAKPSAPTVTRQSGLAHLKSDFESVEANIAHALRNKSAVRATEIEGLCQGLMAQAIDRMEGGSADLFDIQAVLKGSVDVACIRQQSIRLAQLILQSYESSDMKYAEIWEFKAFEEFIALSPIEVPLELYSKFQHHLVSFSDSVFDADIRRSKNQDSIDELMEVAKGFEETFSIDLRHICDSIEQHGKYLNEYEESRADEYRDGGHYSEPKDTTDDEVVNMFDSLRDSE